MTQAKDIAKRLWLRLKSAAADAHGYSMAEVLATVAIIVILCAIVVLNIVSFQANLRQKELDAKAEIIYTAAQEQMTRIMASGREGIFAKPEVTATDTHGVGSLTESPADVPRDEGTGEPLISYERLCYITSEQLGADSSASNALFGQGGLDDELSSGQWVIEYDYKTLNVYSVFYSEGYNCAGDEGYASSTAAGYYMGSFRTWSGRLGSDKVIGSGNHVGYHSGTTGSADNINLLNPTVSIVNAEKLVATATCSKPVYETNDLAFAVTLSDTSGHSLQLCIVSSQTEAEDSAALDAIRNRCPGAIVTYALPNETVKDFPGITYKRVNYQSYELKIVLDSLENDGSWRFTNLYGAGQAASATVYTNEARNASTVLTEGDDITVTVDAFCPYNTTLESTAAGSDTSNSLFASVGANKTALIGMGRHLQNLDRSSGVGTAVENALLTAPVDFSKTSLAGGDLECWMDVYKSSYFNGCSDGGSPRFKPIANDSIKTFKGDEALNNIIAKLNISEDTGSAGLFATFSGQKIANVVLTGASVKGGIVGGLAGSTGLGALEIENCQLYLVVPDETKGIDKASILNKSAAYLNGITVCGGLIGSSNAATLKVSYSLAATIASSGGVCGGLIGEVATGAASIASSYADSYLLGKRAGGLVGSIASGTGISASLAIDCSYSAGYLNATESAAGFADGDASVANSYTLCDTLYQDGSTDVVDHYYTTVHNSDTRVSNIHYLSTNPGADNLHKVGVEFYDLTSDSGAADRLRDTLNNATTGKDAFSTETRTTYAYKLLSDPGQFKWPRINDLHHHGDWAHGFQAGALVYFEEYGVVTGKNDKGAKTYTRPGLYRVQGGGIEDGGLITSSTLSEQDAAAFGIPALAGKEIAVVGDGYGVVYEQANGKKPSEVTVTVSYPSPNGTNKTTGSWNTLSVENLTTSLSLSSEYCVFPLQLSTNNTSTISELFYLRAQIGNGYYFFNPHFAATVNECSETAWPYYLHEATKNISIRSARQLYNLSMYYSVDNGYYSIARGRTFTQDFDATYSAYRWSDYLAAGKTELVTQQPIGMVKDRGFNGTYNGDYHQIADVSFVTPKIGDTNKSYNIAGMFGWIEQEGTVKNLVLCTDYTPPARDDESESTSSGTGTGTSDPGTGTAGESGTGEGTQPVEDDDYEVLADNYYVQYQGEVSSNEVVHMGVLAGYNKGAISNCAIAGYFLAGKDGTVHAYANSTITLGGLVGTNEGSVYRSAADSPRLRLSLYQAKTYAGGFVGTNVSGATITDCYALGAIEAVYAEGGTTELAGFAGSNAGRIGGSYCATAISLAGETSQSYGFAAPGGYVTEDCEYLHGGSFSYVGRMYAFSFDTHNTSATPTSYKGLKAASDDEGYVKDRYHTFVHGVTNTDEDRFPYRGVVTDSLGDYVHYGNWQDDVKLGSLGAFYWEHEEGGGNAGYHMTYLGNYENTLLPIESAERKKIQGFSTLCNAHDDTGVITEYGYGFYVDQSQVGFLTDVDWSSIACSSKRPEVDTDGNGRQSASEIIAANVYNSAASEALSEQLLGAVSNPLPSASNSDDSTFIFCAFTTSPSVTGKDYICLDSPTGAGAIQNGTLKLSFSAQEGEKYVYEYDISPFFGNALSIRSISKNGTGQTISSAEIESADGRATNFLSGKAMDESDVTAAAARELGMSEHQYEVRSVQQLQYINWNEETNDTISLAGSSNYMSYPYLQYATTDVSNTSETQSKTAAELARVPRNWIQTHDIAQQKGTFSPIAGAGTSSAVTKALGGYNALLYSWFGGSYDGQSYTIKNLSIKSKSFYTGLFGVTAGADIKSIIMYGDSDSAYVERDTDEDDLHGAYAIGGLVGIAYDYPGSDGSKTISNCAISGYDIVDHSENQEGLGEACIGGLIGVASINLKNCSAVTDILVDCKNHEKVAEFGNFIRVGGLVGGLRDTIQDCYSGGSIAVGDDVLNETYNSVWDNQYGGWRTVNVPTASSIKAASNLSTHIFLAGIAGSGFSSRFNNFNPSGSLDGKMKIYNCYTYMSFPTLEGTIRSITMIGSNADRHTDTEVGDDDLPLISNCYYLQSSASFGKNLPSYYFNDSKYTLNGVLTMNNEQYFDEMIEGDSSYLGLYIGKGALGRGVKDITLTAQNYAQLSSCDETNPDSTVSKLNNGTRVGSGKPWLGVTVKDSADPPVPIDGKFSYPNKAELQGKNYPFPTVITQNDLTFGTYYKQVPVHVHYGDWPIVGSHWAEGRATMDIFTDMDNSSSGKYTASDGWNSPQPSGYAYQVFTFVVDKTVDTSLSAADVMTTSNYKYLDSGSEFKNTSAVAQVVAVKPISTTTTTDTYEVLVKALDEGTTQIRLNSIESATFTLQVTANWVISAAAKEGTAFDAGSSTMWLERSGSGEIELYAKAAEKAAGEGEVKDYTNSGTDRLTWTAAGENLRLMVSSQADDSPASVNVSRQNDGALAFAVTASYKYPGAAAPFTKQLFITVKEPVLVGLASDLGASETTVGSKTLAPTPKDNPGLYTLGISPAEDNLYLYTATASKDVYGTISSIEIGGQQYANGVLEEGQSYYVVLDHDAAESGKAILAGRVTYNGTTNPAPDGGLPVTVHFTSGNWLSVTLPKSSIGPTGSSHKLSLINGKTAGSSVVWRMYEVQPGKTLSLPPTDYEAPYSSWTLMGWYDGDKKVLDAGANPVNSSDSGAGYSIEDGAITLSANVDLYAKWQRKVTAFAQVDSLSAGTFVIGRYANGSDCFLEAARREMSGGKGGTSYDYYPTTNTALASEEGRAFYLDESTPFSGRVILAPVVTSLKWVVATSGGSFTLSSSAYSGYRLGADNNQQLDLLNNNSTKWDNPLTCKVNGNNRYLAANDYGWYLDSISHSDVLLYKEIELIQYSWDPQ